MFLPLKSDRPLRRPTQVVYALIAINLVIHVCMELLGTRDADRVEAIYQWGQLDVTGKAWYTFVTSAFLHVGWWHVIGNMIFLLAFGPNVEDRFGRIGFSAFYFAGAIASGIGHAIASDAPAVGASGAVAAVTGAFLVLFPLTRMHVIFIIYMMQVPAWWLVLFSIARDFLALDYNDNVANAAHIVGYLFGIGVSFLLLATRILQREPYDLLTVFKQAKKRREIREAMTNPRFSPQGAYRSEKEIKRDHDNTSAKEKALSEERSRVAALIAEGNMDDAVVAYKRLVSDHPKSPSASTLSRQHQYDLANHMFVSGDYVTAAVAYDRFIDRFSTDREAPAAMHLLARLYMNHLGKRDEARGLLEKLVTQLHSGPEREAVQADLDLLTK
ncbi:MAG: rhomboid family intramembrane serine protease [Phycisphaeraceae bacterium]|nr:rhomboid family intramembrane serine protease [Phycisphaerales bacterium]MCB9860723.1 rhomboid family intramembrane serine protease [Phycisphaeraceae bacterium]